MVGCICGLDNAVVVVLTKYHLKVIFFCTTITYLVRPIIGGPQGELCRQHNVISLYCKVNRIL